MNNNNKKGGFHDAQGCLTTEKEHQLTMFPSWFIIPFIPTLISSKVITNSGKD